VSSPIKPTILLEHLDTTGTIKRWLTHLSWVLCSSGDKLVKDLIANGYPGDPCEKAESALEVLETHGWIVRGKLDPVVGFSGLAFSKAWPSVSINEKRRCWCWMPGPGLELAPLTAS
jgi:hypothetical protein